GNAPGSHQRGRYRAHSGGREALAWGYARFRILPHCFNHEGEYDNAGGKVSQLQRREGDGSNGLSLPTRIPLMIGICFWISTRITETWLHQPLASQLSTAR